jgi:hypothetical protein
MRSFKIKVTGNLMSNSPYGFIPDPMKHLEELDSSGGQKVTLLERNLVALFKVQAMQASYRVVKSTALKLRE